MKKTILAFLTAILLVCFLPSVAYAWSPPKSGKLFSTPISPLGNGFSNRSNGFPSYSYPSFGGSYTQGYYRSNGTYVDGYYRSKPDGNPFNNYSYPGNYNPYTGKTAKGSIDSYLRNYYLR